VAVGDWVEVVGELVEVVGEEGRLEEAGMSFIIFMPGPVSGVSEKEEGTVRQPSEGEKKSVFLPPTARDSAGFQIPSAWNIQTVRNGSEKERLGNEL
jgi:hypothetical protein